MTDTPVKPIPDGIHTITPHIVVREAAKAAEWYKRAFGAEVGNQIPVSGGKFMQIELRIGDSTIMIADEFPEAGVLSPQSMGGTPVVLHLSTDDVESLWQRATNAGAEVLQPLQEQFWGDLYGQLHDPFGYRWGLAQHVRDVANEEIIRVASSIFGAE